MWLTNSSIGRKLIMSVTGVCLILFLTFHVLMNAVAIVWPTAYNTICQLLGANWYALVASMGLAALFVLHIVYAFILTLQNRKARGNDRYNVTTLPPHVEWSSNNMLVLGVVVVAFLAVHMIQFWAKMQLAEIISHDPATWAQVEGVPAHPAFGTLFIQAAFSEIWTSVIYIVGFVALWFHMNHGFWSMFQTAGWNNGTWMPRLKKVASAWTTIVVGLFVVQALVFTWKANEKFYLNDPQLQEQYGEFWAEEIEEVKANMIEEVAKLDLMANQTPETEMKAAEIEEAAIAKVVSFVGMIEKQAPSYYKTLLLNANMNRDMFTLMAIQQHEMQKQNPEPTK